MRAPCPLKTRPQSSYYHTLGREKVLIPHVLHFIKNLFPPTAKRVRGNYDLLYQNSIRELEGHLEH